VGPTKGFTSRKKKYIAIKRRKKNHPYNKKLGPLLGTGFIV